MKGSIYLFLIALIFGVIYIFFMPNPTSLFLGIFIKIVPLLCFILFIILLPPTLNSPFKNWLTYGLLFCMFGDATLHWFLVGLFFFLVGHICYIIAFLKIKVVSPSKVAMLLLLFYGIIIAAWVVGNIFKSGNALLTIGVIIYIAVILTMVWAALQTQQTTLIMGALLFLISDSILALNMFVTSIDHSTLLIMSTYYTAQFMFTISVTKHFAFRREVLE